MTIADIHIESRAWTPGEIRRLRRHMGLTQRDFAEVCGVSNHVHISNWERGVYNPSSLARRVFDFLAVMSGFEGEVAGAME